VQRVESDCRVNVSPSPERVRVQLLDSLDTPPPSSAFLELSVLTYRRRGRLRRVVVPWLIASKRDPELVARDAREAAVALETTEVPTAAASSTTQKPAAAARCRRLPNMILRRVGRSGEGLDPSIKHCSWLVLGLLDMTGLTSVASSQRAVALRPRPVRVVPRFGGYWALLAKSRKLAKGSDRVNRLEGAPLRSAIDARLADAVTLHGYDSALLAPIRQPTLSRDTRGESSGPELFGGTQ
jgi:hypothetical protein